MGEARRRRKYHIRHAIKWSFAWPCANCQHPDHRFLVDEMPDDERVYARCPHCTYIMEVGPQHREVAIHGRETTEH